MQQAGTVSLRKRVPRALPMRADMAAWAVVCVAVTAIVPLLQIQNRAPLTWDEAVRVRAGQEFVFALHTGGLQAVWTWANEQTFYPVVAPLMHGLVLLFVDDPVVAAWVPALAAYAALGLLAGALAMELGFGSPAAWITALLCWATPLLVRLASGGFVDSLGACASLATVLLLVRTMRTSRVLDAVLTGVLGVVAFLIRYDFGLVLMGVLAVTTAVAAARRYPPATLKALTITCVTGLVLAELWFIPNASTKWSGFASFFGAGGSSSRILADFLKVDAWAYYPSALWYNPEVGLSSLVADLLIIAFVWSGVAAVRNPRLRVVIVFMAGWYVFYSAAGARSPQFARYMASVLPFGFVLIGTFVYTSATSVRQALVDRPIARSFGLLIALLLALELTRQVGGPFGVGQQFWFIQPNPAAAEIVDFMGANLGPDNSSLLFIGETNEVSPDLVRLQWMRAAGHPGQSVLIPDWLAPAPRGTTLYDRLRREGVELVIAVRVGPGSRLDTPEARTTSAREGGYERFAPELADSANFTPVARQAIDAGRSEVLLWRVSAVGH